MAKNRRRDGDAELAAKIARVRWRCSTWGKLEDAAGLVWNSDQERVTWWRQFRTEAEVRVAVLELIKARIMSGEMPEELTREAL